MIQRMLLVIVALFPVSEVALALVKRSRERSARSEDLGSMRLLWLSIGLGLGLAIAAQWLPWARLPLASSIVRPVALALMVGGLVLR